MVKNLVLFDKIYNISKKGNKEDIYLRYSKYIKEKVVLYGLENGVFAPVEIDIIEVEIYEEGDIKDHISMRKYKKQSEDGSK